MAGLFELRGPCVIASPRSGSSPSANRMIDAKHVAAALAEQFDLPPSHRASSERSLFGDDLAQQEALLNAGRGPEPPRLYPAQANGVKCALRVPLESSHSMPKTLKRLRVALASESRLFTG